MKNYDSEKRAAAWARMHSQWRVRWRICRTVSAFQVSYRSRRPHFRNVRTLWHHFKPDEKTMSARWWSEVLAHGAARKRQVTKVRRRTVAGYSVKWLPFNLRISGCADGRPSGAVAVFPELLRAAAARVWGNGSLQPKIPIGDQGVGHQAPGASGPVGACRD